MSQKCPATKGSLDLWRKSRPCTAQRMDLRATQRRQRMRDRPMPDDQLSAARTPRALTMPHATLSMAGQDTHCSRSPSPYLCTYRTKRPTPAPIYPC